MGCHAAGGVDRSGTQGPPDVSGRQRAVPFRFESTIRLDPGGRGTDIRTRAVHIVNEPFGEGSWPLSVPIVQSSAFGFDSADAPADARAGPAGRYLYTRRATPPSARRRDDLQPDGPGAGPPRTTRHDRRRGGSDGGRGRQQPVQPCAVHGRQPSMWSDRRWLLSAPHSQCSAAVGFCAAGFRHAPRAPEVADVAEEGSASRDAACCSSATATTRTRGWRAFRRSASQAPGVTSGHARRARTPPRPRQLPSRRGRVGPRC